MKTRLTFGGVILGVLTVVSCAPAVLGAVEETTPNSSDGKEKAALKPTSSAATTAQMTEKLKAAQISPAIKEIVRMSESGMDSAVIQAYVENSSTGYSPRAEEIIYLHEHGIPGSVIAAMIQRGAHVREQISSAQANATAQAAPPAANTPTTSIPAQPTVTYVAPQANPTYVYPNYTYASPNVIYVPYSGYSYYSRPYFGFGYGYSSCRPYGYGGYGGGYRGGYGYGGYGYGGYGHGGYGYRHCR